MILSKEKKNKMNKAVRIYIKLRQIILTYQCTGKYHKVSIYFLTYSSLLMLHKSCLDSVCDVILDLILDCEVAIDQFLY